MPGLEGAQEGMGRRDGSALGPEAGLLFMGQEKRNNKQQDWWMEEVRRGGSYFLDPGHLLGSSQREEKHETQLELESPSGNTR